MEAATLPVKIRYLVEFMSSDSRPAFRALTVPTLVLQPGFDGEVVSNPSLSWLKAAFVDGWKAFPVSPRVEFQVIPNARALLLDDQPDTADRAVAS